MAAYCEELLLVDDQLICNSGCDIMNITTARCHNNSNQWSCFFHLPSYVELTVSETFVVLDKVSIVYDLKFSPLLAASKYVLDICVYLIPRVLCSLLFLLNFYVPVESTSVVVFMTICNLIFAYVIFQLNDMTIF